MSKLLIVLYLPGGLFGLQLLPPRHDRGHRRPGPKLGRQHCLDVELERLPDVGDVDPAGQRVAVVVLLGVGLA